MKSNKKPNSKKEILAKDGVLNPHPESIEDTFFQGSSFFDPCDLPQVKYEMIRRVQIDGESVSSAARAFGFSRPSFYEISNAFRRRGLCGLLPAKKGPRRAHKLSEDVMEFIAEKLVEDPTRNAATLATLVEGKFGITVHTRSIERALERIKKNRPHRPGG